MIVSINQPAYLPWLGYFHRIAISDAHIVLDHVQLEKNSFTNRNKIRTREGWGWLTVPVQTPGSSAIFPIKEVEIANQKPWAAKHWQTLRLNYSKAPFFDQHAAFFRKHLRSEMGKTRRAGARDYEVSAGCVRHRHQALLQFADGGFWKER